MRGINVHDRTWSAGSNDTRGSQLSEFFGDYDFIPLNDHLLTYMWSNDTGSNLDLIIISSHMAQVTTFDVLMDSFNSDHFPDEECDLALEKGKLAGRELLNCNTSEMRAKFCTIDDEAKWVLRYKNKPSFISFCDSVNRSMGTR